ncbi:MAG: LysR family transcriptional regulator [Proteobacteria bacterium]|nr:LysR family transcriptional regulator [Pseudomonadota bacterium]
MEIFELKYFLAVARMENINRAAESIHVSAGALSKAVSRLEEELQATLFQKIGRGIRLTREGQFLKQRASEILQLEEDTRLELVGKEAGSFNIYISSEEILQTCFGIGLIEKIRKIYPSARVQFFIRDDEKAINQVMEKESHLALISSNPPPKTVSKVVAKSHFRVCAGKSHPLLKARPADHVFSVNEILSHAFVSPDSAVLGHIEGSVSTDGWRDDKFPRKIHYKVCGLRLMENLIASGLALGYLPDYFIAGNDLVPIEVSDYPFVSGQTIHLVSHEPAALGWLNRLWDLF